MLKQFSPIILVCVETNYISGQIVDLQWLYLVVGHLLATSKYVAATVLNKIKIVVRNFIMKWVYISIINV